ncbi:hypothetical protein [Methanogenium sp. MK-MG]|uniref:hypothetical protein n=1 Tax=Methanogenium sp. MK-MG TaxID=2599926 RepID=UPI0013EC369B|nr:hypothetical protein [Methanogenium sp. MK-MG]
MIRTAPTRKEENQTGKALYHDGEVLLSDVLEVDDEVLRYLIGCIQKGRHVTWGGMW